MKHDETKKEKIMKKLSVLFLVLCMVLASAFANGAAEQANTKEDVTLTFFNWGSNEATTADAFNAMIAAFEAKYPHIHIEVETSNYDGVNTTLLNRCASGDTPDVAQISNQWLKAYYDMDAVLPIDEYLSKETIEDYYKGAISGVQFDGEHYYSAPWIMQPCELYCNMDLLNKAGYDHVPTSWEEMMKMAYDIAALGTTESGAKIYGRSLNSKLLANAGYGSFPDVWANGGDVVVNGEVVFNSPETVKAYTDLQKAVKDGVAPAGLQIVDCRSLFGNGQIGFHVDAPSQAKNWTKINLDVAIIDTYSSDHHLAMFKNTKHPEEAALFIDFLTGPEAMQIYNEYTFVIPARTSVEQIEAYKSLDPIKAQFFKGAATARSLPVGSAKFVSAMEDIAGGIQRMVINGEDVATVVADVDTLLSKKY